MFMFAIIDTCVSSNAMSMYCPSPVRARWNSAARIATVAYMPVERSATATPTLSGAPPGRSSRFAGDAHQAAHRLDDEVVTRDVAHRPGLPETGDRAIDESGVDRAQLLVAEVVAREVARLVILDQHIALRREPARDVLSRRLGDVERDRFLAAIRTEEIGRFVGVAAVAILEVRRAPGARVVPVPGPLDLDDFRAEVGEDLAAPRAGQHAAHVEHSHACQRTRRAAL